MVALGRHLIELTHASFHLQAHLSVARDVRVWALGTWREIRERLPPGRMLPVGLASLSALPCFAEEAVLPVELSSIPTKRKRRSSPSPVLATPLKVVLPSPSSIAHSLATPTNNASPPKTNGDRQHEPKRPKISLTVSSNGLRKSPVPEEKEEEMKQEGEIPDVEEDEEDEKEPKATPLSREIRGALALVISQ